ncbi:MAG: hypothetical protein WAK48_05355, partial [Candidatus Acidiferrum sp.]
CSAFRGSDRFTVTRSVQKGRGISLSRRDLPVISALVSIRQIHLGFVLLTNKQQSMIDKSGQVLRVEEQQAVAV